MKISWNWLGRHVELSDLDPREIAARFTMGVAELEGIEEVGRGMEGVVAGKILSAAPHPESDKLQVLEIDLGPESGVRTLVSGAPNVRVGMITAVATPGTTIASGKTLEVASLRGVESFGMTCSEAELGISDDASGVMDLPLDQWIPGESLDRRLGLRDWILEIDNKSLTHRPDMWGHRGIAREVAALVGRKLLPEQAEVAWAQARPLELEVRVPELCPRYSAVCFQGVKVEQSPLWLRILLHRVGVRAISNVVDLTNFVMMDVANPLHAFDSRHIEGGAIIVRRGEPGETITSLDGQVREVGPEDVLIADRVKSVAIGGVMGGENSEIRDDTTEVILESASFLGSAIRKTSTRLGLRTEASARFEKNLDPAFARAASVLFARMLLELIPTAKITSAFMDAAAPVPPATIIPIRASFISSKLGMALEPARIRSILEALEFQVQGEADELSVTVPSFRSTGDIGIPEDLVEEVGRVVGYDNIVPVPTMARVEPQPRIPSRSVERQLRHLLAGCGGTELILYSFDSEEWCRTLGHSIEGALELVNPISAEQPVLRRSLVPNLLAALKRNQTVRDQFFLFELGRIFSQPETRDAIPHQERRLGILLADRSSSRDVQELFRRLRGITDKLLAVPDRGRFEIVEVPRPENSPWALEGRLMGIRPAGESRIIGWLGQVSPVVTAAAKIRGDVVYLELNLEPLFQTSLNRFTYAPLPRFPRITNDLSFIVDQQVKHQEVYDSIAAQGGDLLQELALVAVFRGAPIPEGSKSLSYRLTFGSDERTLRDEDIRPILDQVLKAVKDRTGGVLRES